MFCSNCGLELKKNSNYCQNCGVKITTDDVIINMTIKLKGLFLVFSILLFMYFSLKIFSIYIVKSKELVTGIWYFDLLNSVIALLTMMSCVFIWIKKRIGITLIRASVLFDFIISLGLVFIILKRDGFTDYISDSNFIIITTIRILTIIFLIAYFNLSNRVKYYYQQFK